MAATGHCPTSERRVCIPCTVCCVRLPIPLGVVGPNPKPAGVPCPRLGGIGCEVYPQRPALCVDFHCAWLREPSWSEAWRPDRSGLLCLREEIEAGTAIAAVYEVRPGALEGPAAVEILAELKRTTAAVAVVDCQGHRRCLSGEQTVRPDGPLHRSRLLSGLGAA
jgi:hypothetical protein